MKEETHADRAAGHRFIFDVVVCGGTPAGIAAAIRAARGGHRVLLTQHTHHLGGMCVNGLGQWDAKSDHRRCPVFAEILDRLETHYRETFGLESEQHKAARYSVARYPVGSYEPSVIEGVFNEMVSKESNITVWLGVYPERVEIQGGELQSVGFCKLHGEQQSTAQGRVFVDATYEGDLAALAGVPYRVGRESRDEFDEPHAGLLYTRTLAQPAPSLAISGVLNLVPFSHRHGGQDPTSPQTADNRIQAYNMRPCVCQRAENRILLEAPPANYDREEYLTYLRFGLHIDAHINGKNSYNSPILPGENWEYPEGNWTVRDRITARHREFALGFMWFQQNEPSLPEEKRIKARCWGLPADEFSDNSHVPYEMYVRETRRIVGRHVLSENDLLPREGLMRPRPFADSIAFTDWYLDSHSCSRDLGTWNSGPDRTGNADFPFDGKLILTEEFRPGMVPYRSLVANECSNLIVPVCTSSTHIAWGSLRLEPMWIHLGEVAGFAACQALDTSVAANAIDVSKLQRTLLDAGASIAFFNQHRRGPEMPDYAELQLAACHGEWDSYDLSLT